MENHKMKTIIEIRPNGDPFGSGYEGSQSDDGGKSWFYRGDIGAQPRKYWESYCRNKGYTLRTPARKKKEFWD